MLIVPGLITSNDFLNFVPQIYIECHSVILHGLLGFEGGSRRAWEV